MFAWSGEDLLRRIAGVGEFKACVHTRNAVASGGDPRLPSYPGGSSLVHL
jgi:hypothetical protein